jgi:MFS transporter, PAT family, beta-lactamase induction signal transducer AmpG
MSEAIPAGEAAAPRQGRAEWIAMALGFASGMPNALLVGSLGVWFTNAGLSFGAIGAFSWIALFYAFKFIWAPAFDWLVPPFANTVGRRRAWIMLCQAAIALCLFGMGLLDPRDNILLFAVLAVIAGFASASQDIVIDAWRIETANSPRSLDRITVQYQFGYRIAALLAGGVALLLADVWAVQPDAAGQGGDPAAGWPRIFAGLAVVMALSIVATLAAPEPLLAPRPATRAPDAETVRLRRATAVPVALGWAASGALLLGFMFYTLGNPTASAAAFRDAATPWILLLTIGAPLAASFWLARRRPQSLEDSGAGRGLADALFSRVLAPLADIVQRYWLWALPILALAMTYRIADSIWGSFAQPFYLLIGNSNSDLAIAQKLVGVLMTMAGIALGGVGVWALGRVPALILGGVLAAVTNLLYADLAYGGAWMDGFLAVTGLGGLLDAVYGGFIGGVQSTGATIFDQVNLGPALNRLTGVIAMENLAGGFASAVHLVWLSSIVNKQYAAVQYALLSSLALLIGVIFRPRIGAYVDAVKDAGVDAQAARFADVFTFAMWIGLLAVALCLVEWWRQRRAARLAPQPAPAT